MAALALPLLVLAACASGGGKERSKRDPSLPILEDRRVLDARSAELKRLEAAFREGQAKYEPLRDEFLREEPGLAPWLAKWMVNTAIQSADRLHGRGLVPERVERVEKFKAHPLFRARRELVGLGATGRRAILVYMLRNTRGQLRSLGGFLLAEHPVADVRRDLLEELRKAGNTRSRRACLEIFGTMPPDPAVEAVLVETLSTGDWQMRGTAIRSLAKLVRARARGAISSAKSARETLVERAWALQREDTDAWVRSCAILALGDADAVDQIRPLVDRLELLLRESRGKEISAAIKSLRSLTGRDYGSSVARWRQWLDGADAAKRTGARGGVR